MTEVAKKVYKKPAMTRNAVILEGTVKFASLNKPRSYDKAANKFVDNPDGDYTVSLHIERDSATAKLLEELYLEAIEYEMAELSAAKKKTARKALPPLREELDKEENETGNLLLRLKRAAKRGAPLVVDKQNQPSTLPFVPTGSKVLVQVKASSYQAPGGDLGVAFVLEAVVILEAGEMKGSDESSKPIELSAALLEKINVEDIF